MGLVKIVPAQVLTALLALSCATAVKHAQSNGTPSAALRPNPQVAQDVRDAAALKKLQATPNTVAVYAKGLVCPSCAIGIRKKVSGLNFIDRSRLNQGVELDAKTQLITLAVSTERGVDPSALSKAISSAGYVPVHLYTLRDDGQLATTSITKK